MAFLAPYTDITFADTYNVTAEWTAYTTAQKNFALSFGRSYIDQNYTCTTTTWDTADLTTIPDEVQLANAIIAEKYALGELTGNATDVAGPVVKKRTKAGSVESEVIYKGIAARGSSGIKKDYREVTTMLSSFCVLGSNLLVRA